MKLSRILLLLSFLAVLSLIAGGYLSYTLLKKNTLQETYRKASLNTERVKSRLSAFLDQHYKMVATLAGLEEVRNALLDDAPQTIHRANAILDHFQSSLNVDVCYLMNHNGLTIAASNRHAPDSFLGRNYAFRPYFKEAMRGRHRVSYMALGVTSGRRGVYFSHPVYYENDPTPIGVVVIKAGVSRLEASKMANYEGIVMFVAPQGIIFMTNKPAWALKTLFPLPEADAAILQRSRQFGTGPWEWTGLTVKGDGRATDAAGNTHFVCEAAVDLYPGWRLVYLSDSQAFFRQLSTPILKVSAYVIPVVCVLVGIIVMLLYRKACADLLQRNLYEEALLKSRETQKVLLNATMEQAVLLDNKGKILAINQSAAQRIGVDPEACVGFNAFDVFPADAAGRIREMLERAVQTLRLAIAKYLVDGQWFEVHAYPVTDSHGNPTQVAIFRRDITAQKQSEDMLVKDKETAEAANRAKSEFLSNMSHELRSPMTVILGYSQMMREDGTLPPEHLAKLDAINQSGKHLLSLINDALHFSRIEAKKESLNVATLDLHALIAELERMFRMKADEKALTMELSGLPEVPRYIATDGKKLRQILINLLTNAIQFTEKGGITVCFATTPGETSTIRLRVQVADTGAGIAKEELDRVFDHFLQTASGQKRGHGSGLGLAISRAYARMMGGDITVESMPGQGSTFTLEIAVTRGAATDIAKQDEAPRIVGLAPGQEAPRVLVAEDIIESRKLLINILQKTGLPVKEAENGEVAVALARQWQPAFVWMDIRMPVMDGLTATRIIKEEMPGTIVVALTAHAFEEEKEVVLAAGCDDFVRKPYQSREIFDVMARHLGLRYQYAKTPVSDDTHGETPAEPSIDPERGGMIPQEMKARLRSALEARDRSRILMVISQIMERNQFFGRKLQGLAQTFDYDEILSHLEENR